MGDYVWASIKIGGHLETIEEAEKFVSVITNHEKPFGRDGALTAVREAVEKGHPFEYEDDQVNYGRFPDFEQFVADNPKLSSITSFGRGGDFDSGRNTIHEGKEYNFVGDAGLIDTTTVLDACDHGVDAVREAVTRARFLESGCVTALTASPAVAAWLKIFGDKAA